MRAESTSTFTTAELIALVVAVPGVNGIEPGIGATLRALDARIRRAGSDSSHFGLHIDRAERRVTVEVCLDPSRPVRQSVLDIQSVLRDALGATVPDGTELEVRVQSLDRG
ncbi:MAG: transcriptional regulator [Dietzia sp.]